MKKYPLFYFSVLSCLFGWSLFIAAVLGANVSPNAMPLGPAIAAILVVVAGGNDRRKEWWASLLTFKSSFKWYLFALAIPIGMTAISVIMNHGFGAPMPGLSQWVPNANFLIQFLVMFVFVGLGEEIGWTAFMASDLLKQKNMISTSLIMSVVRVLWHVPLVMAPGGPSWLTAVSGITAFQFLATWIFKRSGHVWLLAALWHAMHNTTTQYFSSLIQGEDQIRMGAIKAITYVLLAAVVYLIDRRFIHGHLGSAKLVPQIES